jgi:hypothetical protein
MQWTSYEECLWSAPPCLETKHPLEAAFAPLVDPRKLTLLGEFFQKILSIKDATCTDVVEELFALKEQCCDDFDRILELYEYLQGMTTDSSFDQLRLAHPPNPIN